jgi:hypothetical protein
MSKDASQKINFILRYMSKVELCELLQISRGALYLKLKTNKWNALHIIIIDRVYSKIESIKGIVKLNFEDQNLIIHSSEKTKLSKIIYPM